MTIGNSVPVPPVPPLKGGGTVVHDLYRVPDRCVPAVQDRYTVPPSAPDGAALTADERIRWNRLVYEVAALAGLLRDSLSHDPLHGPRITALHALVARIPILPTSAAVGAADAVPVTETEGEVRISAIVDGRFRLIADAISA